MEHVDPVRFLTALGSMLALVLGSIVLYQLRDVFIDGAKWVVHRYFVVQHGPPVRRTTVKRFSHGMADDTPVLADDVLIDTLLLSSEKPDGAADEADRRQTDGASTPDSAIQQLQLDRTRTGLLTVLVQAGWKVDEIRKVIKGDNGKIGEEVEEVRQRLAIDPPKRPGETPEPPAEPPRTIVVRDSGAPPREIPI